MSSWAIRLGLPERRMITAYRISSSNAGAEPLPLQLNVNPFRSALANQMHTEQVGFTSNAGVGASPDRAIMLGSSRIPAYTSRKPNSMPEKLIIIGSGPAAWTAAIYAARAELKPLVFEGAYTDGKQNCRHPAAGTIGPHDRSRELPRLPGRQPGGLSRHGPAGRKTPGDAAAQQARHPAVPNCWN